MPKGKPAKAAKTPRMALCVEAPRRRSKRNTASFIEPNVSEYDNDTLTELFFSFMGKGSTATQTYLSCITPETTNCTNMTSVATTTSHYSKTGNTNLPRSATAAKTSNSNKLILPRAATTTAFFTKTRDTNMRATTATNIILPRVATTTPLYSETRDTSAPRAASTTTTYSKCPKTNTTAALPQPLYTTPATSYTALGSKPKTRQYFIDCDNIYKIENGVKYLLADGAEKAAVRHVQTSTQQQHQATINNNSREMGEGYNNTQTMPLFPTTGDDYDIPEAFNLSSFVSSDWSSEGYDY
jgi:hypothetical protein